MSNVVPMRPQLPKTLTRDEAAALVLGILDDGGKIIWSEHAEQRMDERDVTVRQVIQVLRRGNVTAAPVFTVDRDWKITMEAITAGDNLRVVVAVDVDRMGFMMLVVTVVVI
ncbi:DUF4258 domain-containing protein [Luteibacter sp.]|jgi:hypothetical protein|uniref:DUF4258 domain-containing protein n=1 Tax=Luteibacter sp. TaxID=1886636 RepID=UPI003F7CE3DA